MDHLRAVRILLATLVCFLFAPGVWAQHVQTKVENAEVVYVEGNDVVVKSTNGEVRQFEISDNSKFTVDGKDVTVQELKPGMKLTAMITTALPPRWVDTVEVIDVGTVWKSFGSSLIIKTPEGENKMYRVPKGSKISLGGQEKTLDQLREGDKITATVVRTRPPLETGNATALALHPLATPARVGALLIDEGAKPGEPSGTWGTPSIIILIVVILLVAGLILLAFRRKRKA
jgi:hypothetical protein